MNSPAGSDSDTNEDFNFPDSTGSEMSDQNVRQQQQRLQALLEAAGINTRGVDGALLSNPSVLDHLSSSVNKALMDAKRAMNNVNLEHDLQPPPFTFSESIPSISSISVGDSSYETLRNCLCDLTEDDHSEYLTQACSHGYYELVYVLIDLEHHLPDRKADELIRKIHSQFQNIMVSKLSMTADDRNGNKGEMTPLMEAAYNGFTDIVTLLIDNNHDINKKSSTGNTALMYACCGGFEHIVHNLLCAGANTEIFNENGHTPLMEAASGGHVNCAKLLVHHGAEINCASNEFKESALTLACYKGNYDMVDFLLSAGADREHKTDEMHTALMEASMDGHTEVARLLLDSGCNVNMPQDSFESPLTLAACGGHFDLAKLLIERGANLEEVNDEGYTALMEAAREGHEKVVKVLIDAGADVNQQTEETQETALTLACCAGFIEVATLLINASADIEKGASTPLMEAAQEGYEKLVDYLIESGAKVTTVATNGDTALDLAAENGHTKICSALLKGGANLEHLSEGGRTCLMRAARQGHEETVEYLIGAGADLNKYSENKEHTVLSFACHSGHLQVVKLLLQNGADPNATLKDGSTMLIEAAKGGHTSVVTLLLDYSKYPNIISRDIISRDQIDSQAVLTQQMHHQGAALMTDPNGLAVGAFPGLVDPTQIQPPVPHGHVQTLDQLATDAREAQIRLEALELKIKNAFESKQISEDPLTPGDETHLTNEIAQIQKEKKHKQELMNQLQKVEQEIHLKMVQKVKESIDRVEPPVGDMVDDANRYTEPCNPAFPYPAYDPNAPIDDSKCAIQGMLGYNGNADIDGQIINNTRKEWGFTPAEFQEIMKHIQVLGPAIQKRHLNQDRQDEIPRPISSDVTGLKPTIQDGPEIVEEPRENLNQIGNPSEVTIKIKEEKVKEEISQEVPREEVPVYFDNINDKTESNHDTPLTLACQGGHTELVQLLVSRGAELEHRDKKGFTPLILAATGGHAEISEILLDAGAQIEAQSDRTKDTPLSLACSGGKKEVVELLLSRGAKKEHRNVSDYTPLSLAASGGYIDIIKILLDAGAEINSRTASKLGISPLMLAAMNGHLDAVVLLLDRGADINAQIETNKNTALTLACFQGRSEVVATLLDRRANVEHRAKTGLTPLMEAASGGYVDVGRVLLEKGADVNAPPVPSSRDTALTIASDKGHKMFVELVLNWGAQVDTKNKKGNTPIWLSCNSGHLDVLQKLIEFKGDPTIPDARNCSPLMAAFKKGHVKVVKYLVKKVTQFPSDQECYHYIQSIKDKDPELRMRCAQCVETIITAKERQEKKANEHAEELLREIEDEKKNKKKPPKKKTSKKKTVENEPDVEVESDQPVSPPIVVMTSSVEDTKTPQVKNRKNKKGNRPETEDVPKKGISPDNSASPPSYPTEPSRVPVIIDEDPAEKALRTQLEQPKMEQQRESTIAAKRTAKDAKRKEKETKRNNKTNGETLEFINSNLPTANGTIASPIAPALPEEQPDWNVVKNKKPIRKLVLPSNQIARVIGRSGCNVNAIRDVTGTHIDIEKPKKGGGDRAITIRGNCDSTSMAYTLMEELIEHPDKEISEIIEKHFPNKKAGLGSVNIEKPATVETKVSIEAAMAAVEKSEKIQSERQKQKEEELRKKKEKEAAQKAKEEKEAKDRPTPAIHKVVPGLSSFSNPPTPRPAKSDLREPASANKKVSKTSDLEEQLRQHLQNLRKKDENRKREIEQPDPSPKPPVFIRQGTYPPSSGNADPQSTVSVTNNTENWVEPNRTIPGPIGPPSKAKEQTPSTPIPPPQMPITFLPPTPPFETVTAPPESPQPQPNHLSRRLDFGSKDDTVNPPPGLQPMIPSIESPPNHIHSPIARPQLDEPAPIAPPNPIGPPNSFNKNDSSFSKVKPVQKVIPTVQNPTPSTSYQSNIDWKIPKSVEENHFQQNDLSPSWPPSSDPFEQRHPNLPSRTFDYSNPRSAYPDVIDPIGPSERSPAYQAPIGHGRDRTRTPGGTGFGPIGPGTIGQPPSFSMQRGLDTHYNPQSNPIGPYQTRPQSMWPEQNFPSNDNWNRQPSYNNDSNWNHGLNHGWDQSYNPSTSLGSQSYNSGVSGGGGDGSIHLRQQGLSQPDMRGQPMLDSYNNMFNDAQVQQSQRFAASYNNPDSKSPPFHQRPQWNHKMN